MKLFTRNYRVFQMDDATFETLRTLSLAASESKDWSAWVAEWDRGLADGRIVETAISPTAALNR